MIANKYYFKYIFTIGFFLIFIFDIFCQTEKVKTFYNNGQLKTVGKVLTYKTHEHKRLDCFSKTIIKKKGVWEYYNSIGQLIRTEKYKVVINCDKKSIPTGKWKYWNEQGVLYREEIYENGIVHTSNIEIFKETFPIGVIRIKNKKVDTIIALNEESQNLIVNAGFEIYKYKPVILFSNGKNRIEDLIPYWITPGDFTPDYFNPFRRIKNYNIFSIDNYEDEQFYSYVGLGLYQYNESYSEFIQGKLKTKLDSGKLYCLKLIVKLSPYSGYSIDKIGVLFSDNTPIFNKKNVNVYKPQIVLNGLKSNNTDWLELCNAFVAGGRENFITIGRFEHHDSILINKIKPQYESLFGLDQAAYYLLDKVELYQINSISECNCRRKEEINETNIEIFDSLRFEDFEYLDTSMAIILTNVNFEFGKYELLLSSEKDLLKLYSYLNKNQKVKIEIIGHTDNMGSKEYNHELSENRAKAVIEWLMNKGVDQERLNYIGFGKEKPLFDNMSEENRAKNRRVEFRVINNSN
jgi:OOP family OmpA-OmpF porin